MATQRKSTGTTPLFDMITEVYDTKKRMKAVINTVIETDSDDFEEYAVYAHNCIVHQWNEGYKNGYIDGFHIIFPDYIVEESQWESGMREYETFVPSIPTYSTDNYIDNLVIIMTDSLRCRLLLKAELGTNSDEFVTYPDILESLIHSTYQEAYETGKEKGIEDATEILWAKPTILQDGWGTTITIINNADFGDLYYWINDDQYTKTQYTGPFNITEDCKISSCIYYQGHAGSVANKYCTVYLDKYFTIELSEDIPSTTTLLQFCNWNKAGVYGEMPYDYNKKIRYSINDGPWQSLTLSTIDKHNYSGDLLYAYLIDTSNTTINKGTQISFKVIDDNSFDKNLNIYLAAYSPTSSPYDYSVYYPTYKVYGCISSMFYVNPFNVSTFPSVSHTVAGVGHITFSSKLVCANNLVLLWTSLSDYCFCGMFKDCTSLTTAPKLPATTLAEYCYSGMFINCSSLLNAPELPATIMEDWCYSGMFGGCTALISAPELPATTVDIDCYRYMFDGCTSLVNAPTILPATILKGECYQYMFYGCTSLVNAPIISATTLDSFCCYHMFDGCTSLVNAPALPATIMTNSRNCYDSMFKGCTSLVNAPALPATTIDIYCYQYMFYECTSLITAPELPALYVPEKAYNSMFYGCTSLVNAPALPATTLASYCYQYMFYGCTSLVNAPTILPATTLASYCYQYMFYGCTSLITAPELPATTLASYCYQYMFYGCSNLNYIKCLGSDLSARNCLEQWVNNVASYGTFVKQSHTVSSWGGHIPAGWTVIDDTAA